ERLASERLCAHVAGAERSDTSQGIETSEGGMADCLLRLTKRSYQRPCGAGTSTSRMDQSTSPDHWLGRLATSQSPDRTQIRVDRDYVDPCNLCAYLRFAHGANRSNSEQTTRA